MFMSERLIEHQEKAHQGDVEHGNLYRSAMQEYRGVTQSRAGRLYFTTLWQALAPNGNIYRYIGLESEYWDNAEEIQSQIRAIADTDNIKNVLKDHHATEDRVKALKEALAETKVENAPDGDTTKGFPAIEEFLCVPADKWLFSIFTTPSNNLRSWLHRRIIAYLVCTIQVVAPLVILLQEWSAPTNRLKDPDKFWTTLKWGEVFCLGTTFDDRLHTIQGLMLMELVILIAHTYVQDCLSNATRSSRLPTGWYWYVLGNVTNMWCCIVTALAVPVLFWNESSATTTSMDSLTMLFIFMLDDFAGYACQYMGKTDEDYQRSAAWQMAMLSQCPVDLTDVINASARTPGQIWSIKYKTPAAQECVLMSTKPPASGSREPPRSVTRITRAPSVFETSPLTDHECVILYNKGRGRVRQLPSTTASAVQFGWTAIDWFFTFFQVFGPVAWMVVDKPCFEGDV